MLAIKLQRVGKKHQPGYRLVVAERRSKMAAPPVEDLGSYSPKTKLAHVNAERASYWLGVGAQPTTTVHNLLVKQGVLKSPKIQMKFKVVEKPVSAPAAAKALAGEEATVSKPAEAAPVADVKSASTEATADKPAAEEAPAEEKVA